MKIYTLYFGETVSVSTAERVDPGTVMISDRYGEVLVDFDERAEAFTNLVLFEGFLLRDGLPNGSVPLWIGHAGKRYPPGTFRNAHSVTGGKVRIHDRITWLPREEDEIESFAGRAIARSPLYALQFPRGKTGARGIVYRHSVPSLERQYMRIVSYENDVIFESCVSS